MGLDQIKVLQTGCDFDEEKFRRDIIRPEVHCTNGLNTSLFVQNE